MRQHRNSIEQTIMRRRRDETVAASTFALRREHIASKPLNYWRKRHPLDCGRPGCGLCHSEPKGKPKPSRAAAIKQELAA